MRILINKESGTRHIPKEDDKFESLCGFNGVSPDAYDLWDVGESSWLDTHPEDFGDLPGDCSQCAKAFKAVVC